MRHLMRALSIVLAMAVLAPSALAAGKWNVYVKPTSFRDVLALRDTVWVSTADAGLLRYLRSTDQFEAVLRTPGGLASNDLSVLSFDRSGRLWVGTNGKGVSRLSADGSSWSLLNAFDGLPSDSVSVLTAEGDRMWIGTPRGLALWDGRTVSGAVPDGVNPSPFTNDAITGVAVDGDTVLVGTPEGIWMARQSANLSTWTAVNTGLFSLDCSGLARNGRDIVALANGGTYLWRRTTATWAGPFGTDQNGANIGSIRRVRGAFDGIVAISTLGLYQWNGNGWNKVPNAPVSTSPSGNGGVPPSIDPDGVALAAPAAGLQIAPAWEVKVPPGPAGNDVINVLSTKGSVYVGMNGTGLSRLRDGLWRTWNASCAACTNAVDTSFRAPGYVFALHADGTGRKYVGAWGVVASRFKDDGNSIVVDNRAIHDTGYEAFRHSFGWSIATDSGHRTWMGLDTNDRGGLPPIGIDLYDSTGTWVRSFQPGGGAFPQAGLNNGQIRALEFDEKGRLWIGYAGAGIDRATVPALATDALSLVDVASTVGTLDVFAIRSVGKSLWILTDNALRKMHIDSLNVRSSTPSFPLAGAVAPLGAVHPLELGRDSTAWLGTQAGVRHYPKSGPVEDFTVENSPLPSNNVRSVTRDPDTGVFWFATDGGVASYDPDWTPPPAPRVEKLVVRLYPNPVQITGIGFVLRLTGDATVYEGHIYDVTGRRLRRFDRISNRSVVWDGRDDDGMLVRPGLYFLRVKGGGAEATARLVVVR